MRKLRLIPAFLILAFAHAAAAEVTVAPVLVRSGFFQAPDCTPEADPKQFNECLCSANISKAQVSGLEPAIAAEINRVLGQVPEQLAAESCEGTPTTPPVEKISVNEANANFQLAFQSADVLTVLVTYSTYGAGASHPLEGTEGFTFDLKTGRQIDPVHLLSPAQLGSAATTLKDVLLKKYATQMFDEMKQRTDPFLTEAGCDTCTMYYTQDGWNVRFQLYSVAPYAAGEPTVVLPLDAIPAPETLIAKK